MKSLVLALGLLGAVDTAHALSPKNPVFNTAEFAVDTCTSTTVNVYTTAINLQNATDVVQLASATVIGIYNADSSIQLLGGFDSNVSVSSTSVNYGREISAGTEYSLAINLDKIQYWLIAASGAVRATITKCR